MASYQRGKRVITVDNGFTFWGMVFVWGWLFSKAIWFKGVIVLLLYFPLYFYSSIITAAFFGGTKIESFYLFTPTILIAIIHIFVGLKGNQWWRESLQRKGFKAAS